MMADTVKLVWLDPDGVRHERGDMEAASQRLLETRVGATWLVLNAKGNPLGHFIVPPEGARVKVA